MANTRKWESDAQKAKYEALAKIQKRNEAEEKEFAALQEIAIGVALKAKKDARKLERKEALVRVLNYVIQNGEKEFQEIAKTLVPGTRAPGSGGSAHDYLGDLMKLFPEAKPGTACSFDNAYAKLKLAGSDMRKLILRCIKKAEPAKRIWVSIDNTKQVYTLEGIGANPPKGWAGFVPIDVEGTEAK